MLYLEINKKIKPIKWVDDDCWEIEFISPLDTNQEITTNINSSALKSKSTTDKNIISIKKFELSLNKRTGSFKFENTKGQFNPTSQEFKVLLALMESTDNFANYENLINAIGKKYDQNSLVSQTRDLGLIIRDIKRTLGILPKNKTSNNDIFKNIKNVGYNLTP